MLPFITDKEKNMSKKGKMMFIQLGIIVGMLFLFLLTQSEWIKKMPSCLIKERLGLVCPTCGGTRCIKAFLEGNMKLAFFYHPVIFFIIIYWILFDISYMINTMLGKKKIKVIYPNWYWFIIFLVFLGGYTISRNFFG